MKGKHDHRHAETKDICMGIGACFLMGVAIGFLGGIYIYYWL